MPNCGTHDEEMLELAAANAAALYVGLARANGGYINQGDALTAASIGLQVHGQPGRCRMLVTTPLTDAQVVDEQMQAFRARHPAGGSVRLEDPFSLLDLVSLGFTREPQMPVMARPPSPPPPIVKTLVRRVAHPSSLQLAERIIVEGFPLPALQPWRPAVLLPPVAVPGLAVHVAGAKHEASGAVTSWSDGRSLGVYWLVVLAAHRSSGVGRALLAAALERAGELSTTLVATPAGEALYRSTGFEVVGRAGRWTHTTGSGSAT